MVNILLVICFLATNIMCKYSVNGNYHCNCRTVQCPTATELFKKDIHNFQQNNKNISGQMQRYSVAICKSTVENDVIWDRHPKLKLLPVNCGFIDSTRVVGGEIAGLYEFPWMVIIGYRYGSESLFECSGTLITDRYVLTSAHCIVGRDIVGVRIGEHDMGTDTDCEGVAPSVTCENSAQDIRVDKKIPHKEYRDLPNLKNDIGLLRLRKPVNMTTNTAGLVCLPIIAKLRNHDVGGDKGVVAGWSVTSGYMSGKLGKGNVEVRTKSECKSFFNSGKSEVEDDSTNKICAGLLAKDSCSGHLGEPLMVYGQHNNKYRYIQRGIRSQGRASCSAGDFGVYTDVAPYIKWILDNLEP